MKQSQIARKALQNILTVIVSISITVFVAQANPLKDNASQTFAAANSWRSAPNLLDRYKEADLRSSHSNPKISFAELSTAVKPAAAPGRSEQSAHWANLPNVPTIHTNDVPKNWCGKQALNLELYAAKNLGEIITVGVVNNAPTDPKAFQVNDYFLASIKANWSGWKNISISLNSFKMVRRANAWKPEVPFKCGQNPSIGWDKVSGLYLFSKIFNYQPHPNSEFFIGKVSLGNMGKNVPQVVTIEDYPFQYKSAGTEITGSEGELFNPSSPRSRWWNHNGSEIKTDAPLKLPLTFDAYYRNERALLDYFPRYEPGYVNFTPQGVPTIFTGGNAIQYAQNGKWQAINLADPIAKYAKEKLGYSSVGMQSGGHIEESSIRFDRDGDVYVLAWIYETGGKKRRNGLLLHKSVKHQDWDVYKLFDYHARFEKFVGHNYDALKHPPVIYAGTPADPATAYLLLPEKKLDGTLNLGTKHVICDRCLTPIPHSGEGTQVLSDGNDVYAVYGVPIVKLAQTDPIHKRGMPTYITKYNRQSQKFTAPVLLGYGGINSDDEHNWAVLAIDSKGILHAIINGHHDPFVYTKSLRPHDITAWTSPLKTGERTSYLGLAIDKNDTLYSVSRNTTQGYRFDLALHRLKAGGTWETKHLVSPWRNNYHIWLHNLSIDPITQRLFLSYHAQTTQEWLYGDEIEMLLYQRPDFALDTLATDGTMKYSTKTFPAPTNAAFQYNPAWDERSILTSADGGDSWRMALSKDLQAPAGCKVDTSLICRR